jgi:hypothetical protein
MLSVEAAACSVRDKIRRLREGWVPFRLVGLLLRFQEEMPVDRGLVDEGLVERKELARPTRADLRSGSGTFEYWWTTHQ